MIEKLLNRLGYIHKSQMNIEFYLNGASTVVGDPTDYEMPKGFEEQFFKDLASIDKIGDFLDITLASDMKREFSCQDDMQRNLTKGAFSRTAYLKKGIIKANELSGQ